MTIPYGKHSIDNEDIDAVVKVLRSNFITQGKVVNKFEAAVSEYVGAKFALAVNSGTSALHIACLSLGLTKNDWVWTSPISFVASSNCALYCGARVDFVDIDLKTYNMSIKSLEDKLIIAKKHNKLPKILIVVHMAGLSCHMTDIKRLSKIYNFKIIEDASHAIGGIYKGFKVGSCKYSDVTVFSFHPVKIITTAEGGMIVTNDKNTFAKAKKLHTHGITRDDKSFFKNNNEQWYYEQQDLGYNYRMNELQAALGLSQLKKIDKFIKKRNLIAKYYNEKLNSIPLILPEIHDNITSTFHLYIIRLKLDKIKISHKHLFNKLKEKGILVNLHYIPIYKHPYYERFNFNQENFPNSEKYYKEALSIPIYYSLREKDQNFVIKTLENLL